MSTGIGMLFGIVLCQKYLMSSYAFECELDGGKKSVFCYMSCDARNLSSRFPTRFDTNWAVQP